MKRDREPVRALQPPLHAAAILETNPFPGDGRRLRHAGRSNGECHRIVRPGELRLGAHCKRALSALDQQFAGRLHAVGGAVGRGRRQQEAAGLRRRRQAELSISARIGLQRRRLDLHREFAVVAEFAIDGRELLRSNGQLDVGLDWLAIRITELQSAGDRFARLEVRFVGHDGDFEMRLLVSATRNAALYCASRYDIRSSYPPALLLSGN